MDKEYLESIIPEVEKETFNINEALRYKKLNEMDPIDLVTGIMDKVRDKFINQFNSLSAKVEKEFEKEFEAAVERVQNEKVKMRDSLKSGTLTDEEKEELEEALDLFEQVDSIEELKEIMFDIIENPDGDPIDDFVEFIVSLKG